MYIESDATYFGASSGDDQKEEFGLSICVNPGNVQLLVTYYDEAENINDQLAYTFSREEFRELAQELYVFSRRV